MRAGTWLSQPRGGRTRTRITEPARTGRQVRAIPHLILLLLPPLLPLPLRRLPNKTLALQEDIGVEIPIRYRYTEGVLLGTGTSAMTVPKLIVVRPNSS